MDSFDIKVIVFFGLFFWFIATPMFLISSVAVYQNIVFPAWISYKVDCHPDGIQAGLKQVQEEINPNLEIGGSYNQNSNQIVLYSIDEETIKHEICHQEQAQQNRSHSCSQQYGVLVDELECYLRQNYMDYLNISLEK
jgi:hypothetical protein